MGTVNGNYNSLSSIGGFLRPFALCFNKIQIFFYNSFYHEQIMVIAVLLNWEMKKCILTLLHTFELFKGEQKVSCCNLIQVIIRYKQLPQDMILLDVSALEKTI